MVIAVIALLISIGMPALSKARRNAERATCAAHLREVGLSLQSYMRYSDEKLPYASAVPSISPFPLDSKKPPVYISKVLAPDSAGQAEIFKCPSDSSDNDREPPNNGKSYFQSELSSYTFRWRLGGETLEEFIKEVEQYHGRKMERNSIWLFTDYYNFHGPAGTNGSRRYLYIDGHVTDFEGN